MVGNQATTALMQRLGDDATGTRQPVTDPRSPDAQLRLSGSVGPRADNDPSDVAAVQTRLDQLGYDTGSWLGAAPGEYHPQLGVAIMQFQNSEVRSAQDGVVTPDGATHSALAIGRAPGAGVLDERLDAVVDANSHPAVERLRARITEAEQLQASCETEWSQEQGERRNALVELIGDVRGEIDALAETDLAEDDVASVSSWAHRKLNRASPYYLQSTNADFLEGSGSDTRTCNLTCVAMALEALGIDASSYSGDRSKLEEVRGHRGDSEGHFNYKKAFKQAKDDSSGGTDLAALRLPDFLQLVFVGRLMENGTALKPAVKSAYDDILNPIKLMSVARMFGVAAYARPVGFPSRESDLRQRHVEAFGGVLDQGKQVIAGVGGHFVKIENIEDDGLVINDPATGGRSDEKIPWSDTKGFVKSIMVIG